MKLNSNVNFNITCTVRKKNNQKPKAEEEFGNKNITQTELESSSIKTDVILFYSDNNKQRLVHIFFFFLSPFAPERSLRTELYFEH